MAAGNQNDFFSQTRMSLLFEVQMRTATAFPGNASISEKVETALQECAALLVVHDVGQAKTILDGLPATKHWSQEDRWSVAALVFCRPPQENLFVGSCLPTSGDFLEKGECALNSHAGTILPNPLNANAAEEIWAKDQWDHCVSKVNNVENVIEKLLEVANFSSCKFNLFVPSKNESFYGAIKGGVILKLKDCTLSHFTTGAIIKIDSEVASGSSNDRCSVGELVAHGELFLRESGPERDALALGITNLKTITWFHLYHSTRSYKIAQSAPTSDVRGSICGFLCAEPVSLGLNLNLKLYKLPLSWSLLQHLGSGRTSHVYLVVNEGIRLALKVPRQGFNLRQDIQYLEDLAGIDGIPKIYQQIDSMLALQPVGEPMSQEAISLYRAKGTSLALADLVESLQQVHGRGIVNRDLRPDNIMIAESVYSKGKIRPYLIDWGFASRSDVTSDFSGSVITASDHVLQQICCDLDSVTVTANDDLVSLLRCLYLIFSPEARVELHRIQKEPKNIQSFWKEQMEKSPFWNEAHGAALQLQYDTLKDQFSSL